ncbi:MAG TPA: hypothetical protein VGC66_13240 [Pyrinomonadaceae bacterium]|jgi:hypothetical protein
MSSKKRASKKSKKAGAAQSRSKGRIARAYGDNRKFMLTDRDDSNGHRHKQPHLINPESDKEREKRLAARKALTLKAARIAYENNHRRKAS